MRLLDEPEVCSSLMALSKFCNTLTVREYERETLVSPDPRVALEESLLWKAGLATLPGLNRILNRDCLKFVLC